VAILSWSAERREQNSTQSATTQDCSVVRGRDGSDIDDPFELGHQVHHPLEVAPFKAAGRSNGTGQASIG
jgi:hypothetical protein